MKIIKSILTVAFALAASAAVSAAAVPPVVVTNLVLQKYGEESRTIVFPEGQLFWDAENDALFIGDGNTPGGKAVCPHFGKHYDIDWHVFNKTLQINGNDLQFNGLWSQVAEGGSLVYRFGTNSWFRFVGSRSGSIYDMAVKAYDASNGTMVVTADVAGSPVLQVCTNLLGEDVWQTATNATVTASTDVSTTWTIDLLDTTEFYRVLGGDIKEQGIYAEKPFFAEEGIVMGGVHATNWSDITEGYATTGAVASVERRATDLEASTNALVAALAAATNRIAELEWETSEYWCAWKAADLSLTQTNWIPTNWPAKHVFVLLSSIGASNSCTIGVRVGWMPEKDCRLTFLRGTSGSGTINLRIGGKYAEPGAVALNRAVTWSWVAAAGSGMWFPESYQLNNYMNTYNSLGNTAQHILGNELFRPEHDGAEDAQSLSPSLMPLSPDVAVPTADE